MLELKIRVRLLENPTKCSFTNIHNAQMPTTDMKEGLDYTYLYKSLPESKATEYMES